VVLEKMELHSAHCWCCESLSEWYMVDESR
jgi:hypothetical protein